MRLQVLWLECQGCLMQHAATGVHPLATHCGTLPRCPRTSPIVTKAAAGSLFDTLAACCTGVGCCAARRLWQRGQRLRNLAQGDTLVSEDVVVGSTPGGAACTTDKAAESPIQCNMEGARGKRQQLRRRRCKACHNACRAARPAC